MDHDRVLVDPAGLGSTQHRSVSPAPLRTFIAGIAFLRCIKKAIPYGIASLKTS